MSSAPIAGDSTAVGPLIIIGGGFEQNNYAILDQIKRLANGPIGVLSTASEFAEEVGPEVVENFRDFGIDAQLIPLYWGKRTHGAYDPGIVDMFSRVNGVYFSGGDQLRIMQTFVQNNVETPALKALRDLHARGGLVAGSSAGAAVMSDPIILGGSSLNALTRGVVPDRTEHGLELGSGFGFFGWGIVDQHFIRRGREGRLVVALNNSGRRYGFGVDENTALVIEGNMASVVGATGIIFIDASRARAGTHTHDIDDVWMSYIDNGDRLDLSEREIIPHESKRLLQVSKKSFTRPAPEKSNAFSAYTLHDLLLRLAQGDPAYYTTQTASAFDRIARSRVTVELERVAERSQTFVSYENKSPSYTAIDFCLRFAVETLSSRATARVPYAGIDTSASSRLLLLGSSPLSWPQQVNSEWTEDLPAPIGIIPAASANPTQVASEYSQWLTNLGLHSTVLDLNSGNAVQLSDDEEFLEQLSGMGTLIFPGGDQRRLTHTLLRDGETTRIFRLIRQRYAQGLTLVGVGGAAAAFGTRMIAEGSSKRALLHGSSEDAGHRGMVIEEGLGFVRTGLIDQNFVRRHRLGRLVVACAEENFELGIGLSETSGIELCEIRNDLRVFGGDGVYLASVDEQKLQLEDHLFAARDIALHRVLPGQHFDLHSGEIKHAGSEDVPQTSLDELVSGLLKYCDVEPGTVPVCEDSWLRLALTDGTPALLDIYSHRV